jgi:large subunit ribosomal protein L3
MGTKLGMTRVFDEKGASVSVSVLSVGPCVVTQVRTPQRDGYAAVQIGYEEVRPRNSTQPLIGHDAQAGSPPLRYHREFHVPEGELEKFRIGQSLTVESLAGARYVDVTGVSKGKGFQGGMKRHNFKGLFASHGTERKHRSPGSIGSHASNRGYGGGLKKGKRMAGHLGAERVTTRSLDVVRVDAAQGLLLVKGSVPGHNQSLVEVRPATRLNRGKAAKAAGGSD